MVHFFFFNDTATTEIYTLSLHDALPIFTQGKIPYVLAHRGSWSQGWARAEEAHSFEEAVQDLPRAAWQQIKRRFQDGHRESWWAAELAFLHFGPRKAVRALCVTTDRRRLPSQATWYLSSNLKGSSLEDITQLYAWRNWTEQGYKSAKGRSEEHTSE